MRGVISVTFFQLCLESHGAEEDSGRMRRIRNKHATRARSRHPRALVALAGGALCALATALCLLGGVRSPALALASGSVTTTSVAQRAPLAKPVFGSPFELPFPRLSMWWPDTDVETDARMARYDWVAFGPWDDPAVATRLHALNPDMLVLNATNACETDLDPDKPASSPANAHIRPIPAAWLLTQVGSTLTSRVSTDTRTFHVANTRGTEADGERFDLFVPGDIVVIDGELARINAVDASTKTLSVRRGVVKAAATHASGARIAATIAFWPDSPMMDLTAACPRVTVDAEAGPENWGEYNARMGASLLVGTDYDGLLVDRSDGDESWLLGNSTARSIDMSRTNTVPASYQAFDDAWNAGLHGYELRLRSLLPTTPIYGNWAYPNYDVFNGNNFEGFPNVRVSDMPWTRTVLGPWSGAGSYFEWLKFGQQPNLTTIETYEDDGSTDPAGDGSYDNPYVRKGFRPDYRKMRYGLATALMSDGFFSYEINTNGHGSLGLMWFDEYDDRGRERGYLGQPLEASHRIAETPSGPDLLTGHGAFDTAAHAKRWKLSRDSGLTASASRETSATHSGAGMLQVSVGSTKGKAWNVTEAHAARVTKATQYTLSFWARADRERSIATWIQEPHGAWRDWANFGSQTLTTQWTRHIVTATAVGSDPEAQLQFGLGSSTGTVWIDDVTLQTGSPETRIRAYTHGVAVVNPTKTTTVANLGGLYRRLLGRQAPDVNTGHLAYRLTLGPRDGRVLVSVDATSLASEMTSAADLWVAARYRAAAAAAHYRAVSASGSAAHRMNARRARQAWLAVADDAAKASATALAAVRALSGTGAAAPTAVKVAAARGHEARYAAIRAARGSAAHSAIAARAAARAADDAVQAVYTPTR